MICSCKEVYLAGKIVVVGSFVYDLVVWIPYFPHTGETLLATNFKMYAGGKGFNQAVSARRCGAQVGMVGKVGIDQFGAAFLQVLDKEGIAHPFVIQDASFATSLGLPMIDPQGDNRIIGIPQANSHMSVEDVEAAHDFIIQHQMLMLQLEIPLEASMHAARIAHAAGMTVILNPAPALSPLDTLLPMADDGRPLIDWLMPNEVEAEMLAGTPVNSPKDAILAGMAIIAHGIGQGVIITLGVQGVVAVTHTAQYHIPVFPVTPVDPTGAGDAFCGSFAAALSEGQSPPQALRFASAAGALSVTVAGAEPSLPERTAIEAFLAEHG